MENTVSMGMNTNAVALDMFWVFRSTDEAHNRASATLDWITGFVSKDDELARLLRVLRGAESKTSTTKPADGNPTSQAVFLAS